MTHPQIAAFARLAKENTPPTRALAGQKTRISRTMHGFAYDPVHDEIVVNSPLAQAILVFRGGATGEESPVRIIQGPHTQILGLGYGALETVSVDPANNEIFLPIAPGGVLVFDREANGDVAPKRVLSGPDTGIRGINHLAIDPVHNALIVKGGGGLLIFDRTASGNAKPRAIIKGAKTGAIGRGQFQVYPAKGWIIAPARDSSGECIGVWSITDNGDVAPRWKIPIQKILGAGQTTGIAFDPQHQEIFLANGPLNRVMTFYFPEMF